MKQTLLNSIYMQKHSVCSSLLSFTTMSMFRYFHTARNQLYSTVIAEKSVLSKLRKRTGYSFSKCKEALQKHDNDLKLAEQWLKSQAQAHGWEKATKLQGRTTGQGLVSILTSSSNAVIVEVNCETDFVARNKKFQSLVQRITQACYVFSNNEGPLSSSVLKVSLSGEDVGNLPLEDSKSIKDEIALGIGNLGENIKTRRAMYLKTEVGSPFMIAGYTHPAASDGTVIGRDIVQYGKYGAVVAFRSMGLETNHGLSTDPNSSRLAEVGRQLCQHIVGMSPKEIGYLNELPENQPTKSPPITEVTLNTDSSSVESVFEPVFKTQPEKEETALVNQEFLLDPDMTVRDFLIQNSVEVIDFVRFECGEDTEPSQLE